MPVARPDVIELTDTQRASLVRVVRARAGAQIAQQPRDRLAGIGGAPRLGGIWELLRGWCGLEWDPLSAGRSCPDLCRPVRLQWRVGERHVLAVRRGPGWGQWAGW